MTTIEKIQELIQQVLKEKLPAVAIRPDTALVADLGFDSVDASEFLVLIEDAFGISIGIEEAQKVVTVSDAVSCVDRHLKG